MTENDVKDRLEWRKRRFLEKILLAHPQIEDHLLSCALGREDIPENKRLSLCRYLLMKSDRLTKDLTEYNEVHNETD